MKTKQLLLTMLALFASITVSAMDFEVDGIKYSTTNGGVTVKGYNSDATDLVLNGTVTYEGTTYNVVSIYGSAFNNCNNLILVGDLSACTSIGSGAFRYCKSLTSVGDLSACTSIGSSTFYYCSSLTSVGNLSACTSIGSSAFDNCSRLTSVGDLSACTSIGNMAFRSCIRLTSVGDLSACTSIGDEAFSGCSKLTSVDLSACTSIGNSVFSYCDRLTSVGDLSACTSIGNNAFSFCSSLVSIGDLSACTSIGNNAFIGCSSLASIGDLSACTSIGNMAFGSCYCLEKITLSGNEVATLGNINAFSLNILILVPENLLDTYKTADVWNLIANKIYAIGNEPQRHYDIEVSAKDNTSDIISKIGEDQLGYVTKLKLSGTINSYDIMVIRNKMVGLVNLDLEDANIVANNYEYYTGCHTTDNVLGAYSFYNLGHLLHIKLPKTITSIDSYALSGCGIQEIEIPEGVISIGYYAFYQSNKLATVSFPTTLMTIGSYAFHQCGGLKSLVFPNSLTSIGSHAFDYCLSLTAIDFPAKMISKEMVISDDAFKSCNNLTSITLPENLKTIGRNAFDGCTALHEVRIPSMVNSIGDNVFNKCSNLMDVWTYTLVPQTIAQNTFSNYTSATLHIQKTSHDPYYFNTQWSQFLNLTEFEGTYSQWLINNQTDYVIDDHTGVIDTEDGASGEIEPGSGLILNNTLATQKMGSLQIEGTETKAGSVIANDNNIETDEMHFMIDVNKSKWYFFSFPFRVRLSDIECEGSWIFRYYDGATRAENGSGGWKNLPTGTEYLEPGQGYIFQCNKTGKLDIKVVKENLDMSGDDQRNNLATYTAENVQDASWNFMGNPFTSYFDIDATGYEAPITIWNGSSYEAVRPGDDSYHLRPFQAFFVQKPENVEDIVFPGEERETYNQSLKAAENNAKRRAKRGVNPERQLVNLTISDGTTTDKTRVVFNNKKSMNYEMDCDASKFMTAGVPQLYTLDNKQVQYAINERPSGGVVLGYSAHAAGTYFIEATRMDKPMLLKDQKLGITFDLTNGVYEFETAAGTFNDRFTLVENNTTTGVADILTKTGVSVMPTDGGLAINGAEGKPVSIYGTDGKLISERNGNGQVNLQRGTYVVNVDGIKAKVMVK